MRVRSLIGLSLFAILALGGKCVVYITTLPSSPPFVLAPGQVVHASGLHVRFLIVVSDSRCPTAAACVSAGDAACTFELRTDRGSTEVELRALDSARRAVTFEGYTVELTALDPRPVAGQPIDRADYRATIDVRRH